MSDIISDEIKKKVTQNGGSDFIDVKDENDQIIITENNPFVGRLLKHEYVEADDPRYGNDEGKKHVLTWLTRKNGEKVKKKQSTTSDWFMQKIIEVHDDHDTWDIKWWYEQRGPEKTIPHAEPYKTTPEPPQEEPEAKESSGPNDWQAGQDPDKVEEDIDVDDIPF